MKELSFCYLGVIFKYNNTFRLTIKNNVDKAKKALFKLRAETSGHELAIQTKLHLFDSDATILERYLRICLFTQQTKLAELTKLTVFQLLLTKE